MCGADRRAVYYEVFYRESSGSRQSLRIHDTSDKTANIYDLNPSTRYYITVQTKSRGDFPIVRSDESEELVGFTGKF